MSWVFGGSGDELYRGTDRGAVKDQLDARQAQRRPDPEAVQEDQGDPSVAAPRGRMGEKTVEQLVRDPEAGRTLRGKNLGSHRPAGAEDKFPATLQAYRVPDERATSWPASRTSWARSTPSWCSAAERSTSAACPTPSRYSRQRHLQHR